MSEGNDPVKDSHEPAGSWAIKHSWLVLTFQPSMNSLQFCVHAWLLHMKIIPFVFKVHQRVFIYIANLNTLRYEISDFMFNLFSHGQKISLQYTFTHHAYIKANQSPHCQIHHAPSVN